MPSPQPNEYYEKYWKFAVARWQLLTTGNIDDPILKQYRFTNCFRACDRVSQYLIKNVLGKGIDRQDELFRIVLFKTFNRISTWEAITEYLGEEPNVCNYHWPYYKSILDAIWKDQCLYSPAFRWPVGESSYGCRYRHYNHLRMIEHVVQNYEITLSPSLSYLQTELQCVPMMGGFISMQMAVDISYSDLVPFDDSGWVVCGPGARRGMAHCFDGLGVGLTGERREELYRELLYEVAKNATQMPIKLPGGRALQPIDVQNLFCEFDKYSRIAYPELSQTKGWSGGQLRRKVRPKQVYKPSPLGRMVYPDDFVFPRKWSRSKP